GRGALRKTRRSSLAALVRQSRYEIERLQGLARVGVSKAAFEDDATLGAAIDLAERPVDAEAKVLVATRQRQRIRLNRQIVLGEHQFEGQGPPLSPTPGIDRF